MKKWTLIQLIPAVLLSATLLLCGAAPSWANDQMRSVKTLKAKGNHNVALTVYKNKDGSVYELRARNEEPEPFVITISLEPVNLEPTVPLPFKGTLDGGMTSEVTVFRLTKINPAEPARYLKLSFRAHPRNPPSADAPNLNFSKVKSIQAQGGPDVTLSIYKSDDGSILEFRAQNRDVMSYALDVSMNLENMRATTPLPYRGTLDGTMAGEVPLFRIARVSMEDPFHYRKLAWHLSPTSPGNRPVVHDGVYGYPWPKGKSFTIDNGFNGYGAHQGVWGYAVDFKMPVGSPVTAARAGTVVAVQTRFSKGGNDPALGDKANYVFIQHRDGSMGRYLHIRKDGAVVSPGQEVVEGDLIAYSGNVGWSTDPHLHFDVVVPDGTGGQKTVPFVFQAPDGRRFKPVQGMRLEH